MKLAAVFFWESLEEGKFENKSILHVASEKGTACPPLFRAAVENNGHSSNKQKKLRHATAPNPNPVRLRFWNIRP